MIILTIRTDKPEAEVALYGDEELVKETKWQAHRELSTTILSKIEELLKTQRHKWNDLSGIVCYEGPGSFTGLRIGLSVGNTLANGLKIPIVAARGKDWQTKGISQLQKGKDQKVVKPYYGADAKVTKPKK